MFQIPWEVFEQNPGKLFLTHSQIYLIQVVIEFLSPSIVLHDFFR